MTFEVCAERLQRSLRISLRQGTSGMPFNSRVQRAVRLQRPAADAQGRSTD